ncbi:hypothetical protein WK02_27250 [Burkholderia cepacia]|nr:hypothetical protein WJ46_16770 [Burkholderia cepacia]KVQ25845.1 hypothetical protein WK02_27250 [Burkholderia cepacia]
MVRHIVRRVLAYRFLRQFLRFATCNNVLDSKVDLQITDYLFLIQLRIIVRNTLFPGLNNPCPSSRHELHEVDGLLIGTSRKDNFRD